MDTKPLLCRRGTWRSARRRPVRWPLKGALTHDEGLVHSLPAERHASCTDERANHLLALTQHPGSHQLASHPFHHAAVCRNRTFDERCWVGVELLLDLCVFNLLDVTVVEDEKPYPSGIDALHKATVPLPTDEHDEARANRCDGVDRLGSCSPTGQCMGSLGPCARDHWGTARTGPFVLNLRTTPLGLLISTMRFGLILCWASTRHFAGENGQRV